MPFLKCPNIWNVWNMWNKRKPYNKSTRYLLCDIEKYIWSQCLYMFQHFSRSDWKQSNIYVFEALWILLTFFKNDKWFCLGGKKTLSSLKVIIRSFRHMIYQHLCCMISWTPLGGWLSSQSSSMSVLLHTGHLHEAEAMSYFSAWWKSRACHINFLCWNDSTNCLAWLRKCC